mgnify:FL=1
MTTHQHITVADEHASAVVLGVPCSLLLHDGDVVRGAALDGAVYVSLTDGDKCRGTMDNMRAVTVAETHGRYFVEDVRTDANHARVYLERAVPPCPPQPEVFA